MVCCLGRAAEFLFTARYDDARPERRFLIPVGGAIEPGEQPAAAAARETREELGIEVDDFHLLGVLEDRFEFREQQWDETVTVFAAWLPEDLTLPRIALEENGRELPLVWRTLPELERSPLPVFPPGLVDKLRAFAGESR